MEEKKLLWLITEEAIANSTGIYRAYWEAFKERHPEFWGVPGAPPYIVGYIPLSAREKPIAEEKPKVVLEPVTCKRCARSWTPRSEKLPIQCPKCKSPYWNRERKDTHR